MVSVGDIVDVELSLSGKAEPTGDPKKVGNVLIVKLLPPEISYNRYNYHGWLWQGELLEEPSGTTDTANYKLLWCRSALRTKRHITGRVDCIKGADNQVPDDPLRQALKRFDKRRKHSS